MGAVLGEFFVFRLGMGTMPKTVLHACEEVTGMLRESRRYAKLGHRNRKEIRGKTVQNFTMGRKITPVKYLLMRLFLSLGAVLTLGNYRLGICTACGNGTVLCAGTVIAVPEPTGQS